MEHMNYRRNRMRIFTRQIPLRLLLSVLVLGPLTAGQAQTSFDWLNDAATPREAALANAADIAGTPSPRGSGGTESAVDADAAGSEKELLVALVQYPANIRQESIRFNVPRWHAWSRPGSTSRCLWHPYLL